MDLGTGQGINGCTISGVYLGTFVSIIRVLHSYLQLAGFVGLWQVEAIVIKIGIFFWRADLLWSEERKNIL